MEQCFAERTGFTWDWICKAVAIWILEVKVDKAIENNVERTKTDLTNVLRDRGISGFGGEGARHAAPSQSPGGQR